MKKHFEAMKKAGFSLAFFALISVLFVTTTNRLTEARIAENKAMMLLQVLNEVVPQNSYDNDLVKTKFSLKKGDTASESGFERDTSIYLARKNNTPVAAVFEVTTLKGYSGAITLMVGISATNYEVTGVRVVQHMETPGLGDKMEIRKSNWLLSFNGKSLENPVINGWLVKKDGGEFDQFTGATITPRAVVYAVKTTLLYAREHMNELFRDRQLNEVAQ